jgi:hypothetical protein
MAQQPKVQQFETDRRRELGIRKLFVKIPYPESSKIILWTTRDKRTAQQPKVQQFESIGFQDPQAAAETPGI